MAPSVYPGGRSESQNPVLPVIRPGGLGNHPPGNLSGQMHCTQVVVTAAAAGGLGSP